MFVADGTGKVGVGLAVLQAVMNKKISERQNLAGMLPGSVSRLRFSSLTQVLDPGT